jgi:glucosamine 6-phosphate synthetase-like amidotransferase/phosphosugar isomerase protein
MCGLYGFIGKPTKLTRKMLRELAVLNESRGTDSAGIAIIYKNKYHLYKKAVKSSIFWDKIKPEKFIGIDKNREPLIVIGHDRQATTGIISDKNAHPFQIGTVIMAHNGIISNFDELQALYKTKYEVDSQMIGYLLATIENKRSVFENELEGWFTVPWVDLTEPDTLHIVKHDAPLAFGVGKEGIYFTSVEKDLVKVNRKYHARLSIGQCGSDKLYTIRFSDGKFTKIDKEELKIPEPIYQYPSREEYDYFGRGDFCQTYKPPKRARHWYSRFYKDKYYWD